MKIILGFALGVLLLLITGNIILSQFRQKIDRALSQKPVTVLPTPTPLPTPTHTKESLIFVPYWSLPEESLAQQPYNTLIYFGIAANKSGLVKNELGYTNLDHFVEKAGSKKSLLTIRMINSAENFEVLKDKNAQEKIVKESIALAKKNGFEGIVLNLELSALPFDSLTEQITFFSREFFLESKKQKLSYYITAYGDSYYRVRPFNLAALSRDSDGVFIMTYDLHKAKGNPGPNFPLQGDEIFGYDIERMLESFSTSIDAKKITIVLGMYGYDWEVDDNGKAVESGKPLSTKDANSQLIQNCAYTSCHWERNEKASEIKAEYITESGIKHIVWFEDLESVKRKVQFLNSRGITSFAYWAYSYF